ncbi:glycosyltransferase [Parahaliea aestuarii]|uniref:Glycosyltransferase family 2 protein n=1 Tax=Parahaliea aestuarii TaxID=1852021 RepID=A0A5C8ZNV4_9GAMM|nr:glycosyltransferase [Parahaliea aestuarii]TXS89422.1 glycosyltransferase family 2 protein [Parahaliea aestuarii]
MWKPEKTIRSEVRWAAPESRLKILPSDRTLGINIGFIGSEELFSELSLEVNCYRLDNTNWQLILEFSSIDFVLIESNITNSGSPWNNYYIENSAAFERLNRIINAATSKSLPVAFWHTLDYTYFELFKSIARRCDAVFSADPQLLTQKAWKKFNATYLPSGVQPRIYNPYHSYDEHVEPDHFDIAIDALGDYLADSHYVDNLCRAFGHRSILLYDSNNNIFRSKLPKVEGKNNLVIGGCVSNRSKSKILKQSSFYIEPKNSMISPTRRQRMKLQAAASSTAVFSSSEHRDSLLQSNPTYYHSSDYDLVSQVRAGLTDSLYGDRLSHIAWRTTLNEHTLHQRLQTIATTLGLGIIINQKPKASLILPTIRPHFLPHALQQYDSQLYSNKELIIVFNGHYADYIQYKEQLSGRDDIKLSYLAEENHAGACMNLGIATASGDYIFRFDDDDIYGEHYIGDMMLHFLFSGTDFAGKPLRYYKQDDQLYLHSREGLECRYLELFQSADLEHGKVFVSGSTISGRRSTFLDYPYPDSLGAADTAWYHLVNMASLNGLCTDRFNSIFCRRSGPGEHTWKMKSMSKTSTYQEHDLII